jgi:hypothetical protein
MGTPSRGQQSSSPPSASGMSARQKGCLGCGGAAVLAFVALVVIGLTMGPPKKTTTTAVVSASPSATGASPAPSRSHAASAPSSPQRIGGDVKSLDHGAQQGLTNCVITYKDGRLGAGTSTFSALVLDDSGRPYPPAAGAPYGVTYQLSLTDANGTTYTVTEALGSGSRTPGDNGGSDWFTDNQDGVQVSADSTAGMVESTLPVPLAQVDTVQGNIVVTSRNDQNYLKQFDCDVRPARP